VAEHVTNHRPTDNREKHGNTEKLAGSTFATMWPDKHSLAHAMRLCARTHTLPDSTNACHTQRAKAHTTSFPLSAAAGSYSAACTLHVPNTQAAGPTTMKHKTRCTQHKSKCRWTQPSPPPPGESSRDWSRLAWCGFLVEPQAAND
jgi:hypothetical protein